MKNKFSAFITILGICLSGCADNNNLLLEPITSDIVYIQKAKNNITVKSFSEQQKQQVKLHSFYFDYYSNGQAYDLGEDNEHLKMLVKAEKRIDNSKLILDSNNDDQVNLEEIKKFVTDKIYLDDFRNYVVNFSFAKLDKNADKVLSAQEFGLFNKEIKAKEVKDFELNSELNAIDYNNDNSLAISEYEDFFIKYLITKLTWKTR